MSTAKKIEFIDRLIEAGVKRMEATSSFVSPRAVPQMADAEDVIAGVNRNNDTVLSALVPNKRGIGLANVMAGLAEGIDSYESSFGGIGGCPFAPKATGSQ